MTNEQKQKDLAELERLIELYMLPEGPGYTRSLLIQRDNGSAYRIEDVEDFRDAKTSYGFLPMARTKASSEPANASTGHSTAQSSHGIASD